MRATIPTLPRAALLAALVGCGAVRAAEAPSDAGLDTSNETGDAGWTQCSSPEGLRVCDGPNHCTWKPTDYCACTSGVPGSVGVCGDERVLGDCIGCPDGDICLLGYGGSAVGAFCAPYNLGVLFAENGAADRVHYADGSAWTGAPLPVLETCPTVSGFRACGGNCGGCATGEVCTGRSPAHPLGWCAPLAVQTSQSCGLPNPKCRNGGGTVCFTYLVEPASQTWADETGYCLPPDECQALAAGLPGGGKCTPAP